MGHGRGVASGQFSSTKSIDEEDTHLYQTLFNDHAGEVGVFVSPRSLLRIRIEKGEVTWSNL